MGSKIKKIVPILIIGTMAITGCSKERTDGLYAYSKDELVSAVEQLTANNQNLGDELNDAKSLIAELSGNSSDTAPMSKINSGSSELGFNSFSGNIIIPDGLEYPNSYEVMASADVSIASSIKVSPNKNWVIRMDGNTAQFEHSSNISGVFEARGVSKFCDANEIKTSVIEPLFSDRGYTSITYKNIYINGVAVGVQASTQVYIDSDLAQIRVGTMSFGQAQLTYYFIYRGEYSSSKEENIDSLLNTVYVLGQSITIN